MPIEKDTGRALAAIVALAALARVILIGHESYWYDEIWSVNQVAKPFGEMLAELVREDVHPPLYSIVLWGWTRTFGHGEVATRLLSALFSTLAVLPLYGIGRMLWDRRTGLLAATLLALNAYVAFYGRETRSYSLMLFLSLLSIWALLRWVEQPGARARAAAWIAASVLLAYTHVYGTFVLVAEGLFVLWRLPAMRLRFVAAAAVVAVAFAPWLPFLLGQVGRVQQGFWIDPIRPGDPFRWLRAWSAYSIPLSVILPALWVMALREPSAHEAGHRRHRRSLLGLFIAVPLAIPVTLSVAGEPIFYHKYPIAILGAFSLLAARGLLLLPRPAMLVAGGATALLLLVQLPRELYLWPSKEQWREVSVLARAEADAGALVVSEGYNRPYLPYYLTDRPITWVEGEPDLAGLGQAARAAGGRLLYVQVHPAHGEHEETFDARWQRLRTDELVGARAALYEVRQPAEGPAPAAAAGAILGTR
jgi:hypothetical protein